MLFACWFPIQIFCYIFEILSLNSYTQNDFGLKKKLKTNVWKTLIVGIQTFKMDNNRQTIIKSFRILLQFFLYVLLFSFPLLLSNSCARRHCCNNDPFFLYSQTCTKRSEKNLEPLMGRLKVYGNECSNCMFLLDFLLCICNALQEGNKIP